ncbi:DUF6292 family protein [Actinophytocola sp.]|uniref:DUF6292 family protein n=1 Tax=Actinophytocola sp. TaxID=1872138 RepID=UPI002ED4D689
MQLESWSQPARGLREYFRRVARVCGSGEAFSVRLERPLTGYIPLEERVAAFPDIDVALVWDERTGWRSVLEPAGSKDLVTLSYLPGSVCPPAEEVAEFAANPGAGAPQPAARNAEDALDLLSQYAVVRLLPLVR